MKLDQWQIWSNMSLNGEVCGILNCSEEPKSKCSICDHFYCIEHLKIHLDSIN